MDRVDRRSLLQLAAMAGAGSLLKAAPAPPARLFDGRTLEGWTQIENSATSFSPAAIADPAALAARLAGGTDAISAFLRARMDDSLTSALASFSPSAPDAKITLSALAKALNDVIAGPSIAAQTYLDGIVLRDETKQLLQQHPRGWALARLNKLILEDAFHLSASSTTGWIAREGVMASTGSGRGVIYTAQDYSRFRLLFTMRHVSGNPDHQACVLIFCARPLPNEKPLDALGGIQFQVPNGGHWDYRPGKNNNGGAVFTSVARPGFDAHQWSRVEIFADASRGMARMAVAQPPESRAVEVLAFHDPAAGRAGPIAWQMHNAGLFDEYKDVTIDANPPDDGLVTAK